MRERRDFQHALKDSRYRPPIHPTPRSQLFNPSDHCCTATLKMKLNEWINAMVEIGFVYKYHDLVTSKHVLGTVGVFEKYGSKEVAKVKLCEAPFLNCKGESPSNGPAAPSGFTLRI